MKRICSLMLVAALSMGSAYTVFAAEGQDTQSVMCGKKDKKKKKCCAKKKKGCCKPKGEESGSTEGGSTEETK